MFNSSKSHRCWAGAAFFVLLSVVIFGDLFLSDRALISKAGEDLTIQYTHWRNFAFTEWRQGNFPLWNPYIFSGAPFFSGFQSALLYPLNWTYFILPLRQALNLEVALHFFLAGFFTFLWVRHIGCGMLASCLAGAGYALSSPYFAHIHPGHLSNLGSMAWAPLVLLSVDRLLKNPSAMTVILGGLAVAMQVLAGHPQYVYYTGVMATGYFLLQLPKAKTKRAPLLVGFASMFLVGAGLCAFQILSGMEAASESVRGSGMHYDFASSFYFPLDNLLTLFSPLVFGGLEGREYWGHFNFWEMTFFLGIFGGFAALLGSKAELKRRELRFVLPLLVAVLLALGKTTPIYDVLYQWVPGIKNFRGISKFIFAAALFMVPLIAIGFDELSRYSVAKRRRLGLLALAIGIAGWAVARFHRPEDFLQTWRHMVSRLGPGPDRMAQFGGLDSQFVDASLHTALASALTASATFLLLGVVLVFARSRFRTVFASVAILELVCHAFLVRATQDTDTLARTTDALATVMSYFEPHERYVYNKNPNVGMSLRHSSLWGSDPFVTKRYAEFIAVSQGVDPDKAAQDIAFTTFDSPLLDILNFRRVFDEASLPIISEIGAPHRETKRFDLIDNYVIASNRNDAFRILQNPSFDHTKTVLLEQEPTPKPHPGSFATLVVTDTSTDHVDIKINTDHPTILLVRDNYSAGWTARSLAKENKQIYAVMPANYVLRAVPLAAGKHHIRLEYRPRLLSLGLWISGGMACLLTLVLLYSYSQSKPWLIWRRRSTKRSIDYDLSEAKV